MLSDSSQEPWWTRLVGVINDVYPINVSKKFFTQRRKDKDAEKSLNIFFAPLRSLWAFA